MTKLDFDSDDLFDFDDNFFGIMVLGNYDKKLLKSTKEKFAETRKFCREVLKPHVLQADLDNAADHGHLSWDIVRLAAKNGQLTGFIPPMFGGTATGSMAIMGPMVEERAAVDTAYCGMMGGHELGLASLISTFNMQVFQEVCENVVKHKDDEKPYLIDCAITEPSAGTDVEEVDLYPKAKMVCHAKRVNGGAVLNGTKCFISTGHMATDHNVMMPFDLKDPINTFGSFLVKGHSDGFSLGRKEIKMGHRSSAISELIFDDVFVPKKYILMDQEDFPEDKYQGGVEHLLGMVLGITRVAVGAMGAGNARGSFERSLALAKTTKYKGKTIINQQWAQNILTNMYMNVMMARTIYMEATYSNMTNLGGGMLGNSIPEYMGSDFVQKLFKAQWFQNIYYSMKIRKKMYDSIVDMTTEEKDRVQYMSSMAKVVGTDMGMENAHLAVEFMGRAGVRHDHGIEKGFRDAKLLQIFEGTNQLNRLNIFKHKIARNIPGCKVF